jgi:hypothetical protein
MLISTLGDLRTAGRMMLHWQEQCSVAAKSSGAHCGSGPAQRSLDLLLAIGWLIWYFKQLFLACQCRIYKFEDKNEHYK